MSVGLADKHVFVTGGARGIGLAIATAFVRAGARLSIVDSHAQNLEETLRDLRGGGASAHGDVLDVSDSAAVEAAVKKKVIALTERFPLYPYM